MDLERLQKKLTWHKAEPQTEYSAGMIVKTDEGILLVGDVIGFDPGEVETAGCGRCKNILTPVAYAFLDELF